jgi:hypothetical protein
VRKRLRRFRGEVQHDVKASGQLAEARPFDRDKINNHRFASAWVSDSVQDAVARVPRLAFDVTLRRELLASLDVDGEVNVSRASGIDHRLDGAEVVFSAEAGQEAAKSLKVTTWKVIAKKDVMKENKG